MHNFGQHPLTDPIPHESWYQLAGKEQITANIVPGMIRAGALSLEPY